jgi:predicted MFS family arabinose efflux permease
MTQAKQGATGEIRAVIILSLGFGLVGIDRFLISAMFPTIARDLNLGYGDIGTIAGALAIAWGIAALFMGTLPTGWAAARCWSDH